MKMEIVGTIQFCIVISQVNMHFFQFLLISGSAMAFIALKKLAHIANDRECKTCYLYTTWLSICTGSLGLRTFRFTMFELTNKEHEQIGKTQRGHIVSESLRLLCSILINNEYINSLFVLKSVLAIETLDICAFIALWLHLTFGTRIPLHLV